MGLCEKIRNGPLMFCKTLRALCCAVVMLSFMRIAREILQNAKHYAAQIDWRNCESLGLNRQDFCLGAERPAAAQKASKALRLSLRLLVA